MSGTVGEIVSAAATLLGESRRGFLENVADFVEPQVGGDSDPSRETLFGYEHSPRTRCSYRFAGMVLDVLHKRRQEISDKTGLHRLRRTCLRIMREDRKARYEHPARTNAASRRRLQNINGVYLLFRRSRTDGTLRRELLILDQQGRGDANAFATYITPELVCRGTWCVIQQNVCCMTHGFRGDYARRDVVYFHFLYEEREVMSGFSAGLTSLGLRPAALPTVAVKTGDKPEEFQEWADASDAELRHCWRFVRQEQSKTVEKLGEILDTSIVPENGSIVVNDGNIVSKVLGRCPGIEKIASKAISQFKGSASSGRSWNGRS
jgi:hypothetical protein